MINSNENFDAGAYCSRKLWDMVNPGRERALDDMELKAAIAELEQRRHFLEQLQASGLSNSNR